MTALLKEGPAVFKSLVRSWKTDLDEQLTVSRSLADCIGNFEGFICRNATSPRFRAGKASLGDED